MSESRENLVIVRAGDQSLHPQWLSKNKRTWDLVVSYYGDFPDRYRDQYDVLHHFKGSKWEGLADFINNNPELISQYKYIWLPDDDLLTTTENINNFFKICGILNLTIAQPALTNYSYFSWKITLQQPGVVARITNFVEVMAPCFKRESLHLFSPYFTENSSGWGLEWLWYETAKRHSIEKFGVIDATPIFHTRKVGSAGHGGGKNAPAAEMKALLTKHAIQSYSPKVLQSFLNKKT